MIDMSFLRREVRRSLPEGVTRVLAAVSGGADSVALLRALEAESLAVGVAHVNFGLRGEASDGDENFVRHLCAELGVPLYVRQVDVARRMQGAGESVEMACRSLRYDFFDELCREHGYQRIVVAHNADDNVETMLLNMLRGTGVTGVAAMSTDNGRLWRPLLAVSGSDLRGWLDSCGYAYRIDATNLESDYRRNFLRNEVIPMLESRWAGARGALEHTRRNMEGVAKVYKRVMERVSGQGQWLDYEAAEECGDLRSAVYEFVKRFGGSETQADEITDVIRRREILGHDRRVWQTHDYLLSAERDGLEAIPSDVSGAWRLTGEPLVMDAVLAAEIKANKDENLAYLPYDPDSYNVRPIAEGDRLRLFGGGSVRVFKLLRDSGLRFSERRVQCVVENRTTGRIVWVPGLKRAADDLVNLEVYGAQVWRCHINCPLNLHK